jgi:hypothetical protein
MVGLELLAQRYARGVDVIATSAKPELLDVLRTGWLLDRASDRPTAQFVTETLGDAFGMLLKELLEMTWCEIKDTYGVSISMVKFSGSETDQYAMISVPPHSYVKKREDVMNAEVFTDGVNHLRQTLYSNRS